MFNSYDFRVDVSPDKLLTSQPTLAPLGRVSKNHRYGPQLSAGNHWNPRKGQQGIGKSTACLAGLMVVRYV